VIALIAFIFAFCLFISFKALQANNRVARVARERERGATPQQKRLARELIATYPAFMVLGAGIGALVGSGDRVGGAIIGFIIGMFAWLPAIWIFALEVARRRRVALRGQQTG
jgi:hypothetical protein